MPALADTVQKLSKLTTDDDARISQLTEQILKDPSLTSRVLQVSNSVIYKGFGGNIKTITYAIVMLGFTTIRDISLSMQILDNVLKKNPSQTLLTLIANSFHGAMQARAMMSGMKVPAQEEIFISTLLLHFVEMAILSRDDEAGHKLDSMLKENDVSKNEAATKVLGCNFNLISMALAKQWESSSILIEALSNPRAPSKSAEAVLLGDELSQVAALGWNAEPVKAVVKKIAKFRNVDFGEAMADVMQTSDLARELSAQYGAAKVQHLIPGSATGSQKPGADIEENSGNQVVEADKPSVCSLESAENNASTLSDPKEPKPPSSVGNVQLQMEVMQKLNTLIAEKRMDVNAMLSLVMNGMCDAIGMERVIMALVTKDRKRLVAKFSKGQVDAEFKEGFKIELNEENVFTVAITTSQQLWVGSKLMAGRAYLHTSQVQTKIQHPEYFVAPIIVSRKPIGVFYADRALSGQPLNEQQYAGFSMLAQQAGMALSANQG